MKKTGKKTILRIFPYCYETTHVNQSSNGVSHFALECSTRFACVKVNGTPCANKNI